MHAYSEMSSTWNVLHLKLRLVGMVGDSVKNTSSTPKNCRTMFSLNECSSYSQKLLVPSHSYHASITDAGVELTKLCTSTLTCENSIICWHLHFVTYASIYQDRMVKRKRRNKHKGSCWFVWFLFNCKMQDAKAKKSWHLIANSSD